MLLRDLYSSRQQKRCCGRAQFSKLQKQANSKGIGRSSFCTLVDPVSSIRAPFDMCPSALAGHPRRPTRAQHCNNLSNGGTSKWRKHSEPVAEHKRYEVHNDGAAEGLRSAGTGCAMGRLNGRCSVRPSTRRTPHHRVAPHLNACPHHCMCAMATQNSVQPRCETHHTPPCPPTPHLDLFGPVAIADTLLSLTDTTACGAVVLALPAWHRALFHS